MNPKIIMVVALIIGIVLVLGYCFAILNSDLPTWAKWILLLQN